MTPGRSSILTWHSLDESGSVISTPPDVFRRQMEFLAASGIPVLPLDQVLQRPGSVAITFDDGFANLAPHALPLLHRYNFPATIFVVSKFCGKFNNWPSQPANGIPMLPLLSWKDLAELPPAITIGAHTATHPDLSLLTPADSDAEMHSSKDEIEQRLGKPVRWFAYPYGASSPQVRKIAERHFDLAVGTALGWLPSTAERMDLPRIDTYYLRGAFPLDRMFTAYGAAYVAGRRLLRDVRRVLTR
ncbi:MAG: polysaccharide deacetylase family protein [Terriglobia bacterium]